MLKDVNANSIGFRENEVTIERSSKERPFVPFILMDNNSKSLKGEDEDVYNNILKPILDEVETSNCEDICK